MESSNEKIKTSVKPIANTRCLAKACDALDIPYVVHDEFGNWIEVQLDKPYHFVNSRVPFNDDAMSVLCKDKGFSYELLHSEIQMPKSISYMNPNTTDQYKDYAKFDSVGAIVEDLESNFSYPVIIKMNRGARGHNIFRVTNRREAKRALKNIFNPKKRHFDYVALVQEEIFIHHEYRMILFKGGSILLYEKKCGDKRQSLSPLHNDGAEAVYISPETDTFKEVSSFLRRSKTLSNFEFIGVDVVVDHEGNLSLLEVNTYPGFSKFTEDNGDEKLVEMYTTILDKLRNTTNHA